MSITNESPACEESAYPTLLMDLTFSDLANLHTDHDPTLQASLNQLTARTVGGEANVVLENNLTTCEEG